MWWPPAIRLRGFPSAHGSSGPPPVRRTPARVLVRPMRSNGPVVRDLGRVRVRGREPDDLEVRAQQLLRGERQVRERRGQRRPVLADGMDGPGDHVPLRGRRRRSLGRAGRDLPRRAATAAWPVAAGASTWTPPRRSRRCSASSCSSPPPCCGWRRRGRRRGCAPDRSPRGRGRRARGPRRAATARRGADERGCSRRGTAWPASRRVAARRRPHGRRPTRRSRASPLRARPGLIRSGTR